VFEALLPETVAVVERPLAHWRRSVDAIDERFVRDAVRRRQLEFATGRECAREALHRLGAHPGPLTPDARRAPQWPAGFVGSISHCEDYCVAAAAPTGSVCAIGVDVESRGRVSHAIQRMIFSPRELERLRRLSTRVDASVDWPTLFFSAKESFYKAHYALTGESLGLRDIDVGIREADSTFDARVRSRDRDASAGGSATEGRFAVDRRRVYTAFTVRTTAASETKTA